VEQEKVIEFLRKHIGVSYERAKDVLTKSNNDIIEAIMMLRGKQAVFSQQFQVHVPDLQDRIMDLLKQAHVIRITVSRKGRTLIVIPAWLGAISFIMFPLVSFLTMVAALYNDVTLTVERMEQ
jgi:hypothetical protein